MKCCKCKYNKQGITDYGPFNECELFGFECYIEFYEFDCPYINDNYELTKAGEKAQNIF